MALPVRKPAKTHGFQIVLYGARGVGKTTLSTLLAAGPTVSIATENADLIYTQRGADIDVIDPPSNPREVISYIRELARGDHRYKTLIFESVTAFDVALVTDIVDRHAGDSTRELRSINAIAGGYGKGAGEVGDAHANAAKYLAECAARGMRVIIIAHDKSANIDPPDGAPYSKWVVDTASEKHAALYLREASVVARLSASIAVDAKQGQPGKARAGRPGTLIDLRSSPATECKSRIDELSGQITWTDITKNPFGDVFDRLQGITTTAAEPAPVVWPEGVLRRVEAVAAQPDADEVLRDKVTPWLEAQGFEAADIQAMIARVKSRA